MAKRSKSGRILIRVGADAVKRENKLRQIAEANAAKAAAKDAQKAATALRRSLRRASITATQVLRALERDRQTQARRAAAAREKARNRSGKRKPKRPYHPRSSRATEKYNSYARRRERSKQLRATRSSPNTFTCNGYTIRVTEGSNPVALSCTCPDFTQTEGKVNWIGSSAGPFNPCKHMMAVEPDGQFRVRYSFTETQRDGCGGAVKRITYREILTTDTFTGPIRSIAGDTTTCAYWDSSLTNLLSSVRIVDGNFVSQTAQGTEVLQNVIFNNGSSATGFLSNFAIVAKIPV